MGSLRCAVQRCNILTIKNYLENFSVVLDRESVRDCLCMAASKNDVHLVDLVLKRGVNPNTKVNYLGDTSLHVACRCDSRTVAKMLLTRYDISLNVCNSEGNAAIHILASRRCSTVILGLLLADPRQDVNLQNGINLDTALHIAAHHGHCNVIRLIMKSGADVEETDEDGNTALHRACLRRNWDAARLLMETRSATDKRNVYGETVLHILAKSGNVDLAKLLQKNLASLDINSMTHSESQDCYRSQAEAGATALHIAAKNGHASFLSWLISLGADITMTTRFEYTALHLASANGSAKAVNELLGKGACVSSRDSHDVMPHHLAARGGHAGVLSLLLQHNCPINSTNRVGMTAYDLAIKWTHYRAATLLVIHGTCIKNHDNIRHRMISTTPNKDLRDLAYLVGVIRLSGCGPHGLVPLKSMPYPPDDRFVRSNLASHCRRAIRRHLVSLLKERSIWDSLMKLPLPTSLKQFLLMKEFLPLYDYECVKLSLW